MDHRADQEHREQHQEDGVIGREYHTGEEKLSPWQEKQAQESARFKHKKESERSDNVEESVRYWQARR